MSTLKWDILRDSKSDVPYYLPHEKMDYIQKVDTSIMTPLTEYILNEIEKKNIKKIFSLGAGIAKQEFQLKKYSDLKIIVTDNSPTILRIKQFEVFDDAFILDALRDPFQIDESYIVLLPRIDTEFEDHQLEEIFAKCYLAGVKHICFIPAELLCWRTLLAEAKILFISTIKRQPKVFCGYVRSMKLFKKIWSPYYDLTNINKTKQVFFLISKK